MYSSLDGDFDESTLGCHQQHILQRLICQVCASGVYNETVFRALDYLVARAGFYGIKLIMTFGDQWNKADSKINYLEWGNATDNTNLFFTDPTIQGFYRNHIKTIVNRNVSSCISECGNVIERKQAIFLRSSAGLCLQFCYV